METRKDRMNNQYSPKLHDYVVYRTKNGTHEGWVYYAGDEHITIELGVKDKPHCEYTKEVKHKKIHVLLVCPVWDWDKLEYVTSRKDYHDESFRDRTQHTI